jgi:hypothetical protein
MSGMNSLAGRGVLDGATLIHMKRPWDALAWWEIRRIPYNLVLIAKGLLSGFIFAFAGSHVFRSDTDFGSPFLGFVFYGIAANFCYTLGWITELVWTWGDTAQTEKMRPRVFRVGLIFSAGLTLLPAIVVLSIWTAHSFQ